MLKYTHGYIGSKVADHFGIKGINKLVLVFGNVIPDYLPSCFYKKHSYENWFGYFNAKRYDLVYYEGLRYFYLLGVEMHLCCDFFTRPHNCENLVDFLDGHVDWEKRLHTEITENFMPISGIHKSISKLHDEYLKKESSVENDLLYASLALSSLFVNF